MPDRVQTERLAAVHAPGLAPMDFHAVVEVLVDDVWQVRDTRRLAPGGPRVRVATGRGAVYAALATTRHGHVSPMLPA